MIEVGSPRPAIYYKGKKVWECVLAGSEQTCRDGILVFEAMIPEQDGTTDIYPQLFAIRGAGPPVVLSQRIFKKPVAKYDYELWNFDAPTTNGLRVVFQDMGDTNGNYVLVTNNVSWSEIKDYMQEAEKSATIQTAPLGSYRLLPIKAYTPTAEDAAIVPRAELPIERPKR